MQRDGADKSNMQLSDFLCDFCERAWDGAFPMVEGHEGSLICGECLTSAYRALMLDVEGRAVEPSDTCTLCLEDRDHSWRSPKRSESVACLRCVKQSAGRLHKDEDWEWCKPE